MLIEKGAIARAVKGKVVEAETRAYTVLSTLWHAGVRRVEGETIHLTDVAAKYLRHAIQSVEVEIVDAVKTVTTEAVEAVERPFHHEAEPDHGDQP